MAMNASDTQRCPECGSELPRGLPGGVCPRCADPLHGFEEVVRWCERKPVVATLIAITVVVGLAGITGWLLAKERQRLARSVVATDGDRERKQAELRQQLETLYTSDL